MHTSLQLTADGHIKMMARLSLAIILMSPSAVSVVDQHELNMAPNKK